MFKLKATLRTLALAPFSCKNMMVKTSQLPMVAASCCPESRYATIEKECLAIVWAIRKFEYYLYGRVFEVHTDHKPLTYMQAKKMTNKRIMRWCMSLQEHRFRLVSIKGKENVAADAMSRLV